MELALGSVNSLDYRVEVSGWDSENNFFVEKAMLHRSSDGQREVSFKNTVRQGCVVFVRLLLPAFDSDNFPVAYRAGDIGGETASGQAVVRLTHLRPRAPFKEVASNFASAE